MLRIAIVLALVTISSNQTVVAECIIPPPPCEALTRADVVLVADVLETSWRSDVPRNMATQVVTVRVIEKFKGASVKEQVITAKITSNAETIYLEAGKRYLIYALENNGTAWPDMKGAWDTSCSRTKIVDLVNKEASELRRCSPLLAEEIDVVPYDMRWPQQFRETLNRIGCA